MPRKPVPRSIVECANCGKEFTKRDSDIARVKGRHFCSVECRNKMGCKPRTGGVVACATCGKKFYRPKHAMDGRRYCSNQCRDKGNIVRTEMVKCQKCGTEFLFDKDRREVYCSRECRIAASYVRPLDRQHNGKPAVVDSGGYVRVYEPGHPRAYKGGWVLEHRLIIEATLGRPLEADEHVHHLNHDRTDNRPENLAILSHSEHSRLTGTENGSALQAALEMRAKLDEYERRFGPLETNQGVTP